MMKKTIIKKIYKLDKTLAEQAANVLDLKIRKVAARETLDEMINYLSKQLFQYTVNEANKKGYHFKATADEFEKAVKNLLTSKLR